MAAKVIDRIASDRTADKPARKHGVWKPEGSPFWYCSFTVMGVRFNGTTKLRRQDDAIAFAKRWKAAERKKLEMAGATSGRNMSFLQAMDRYLREWALANGGRVPVRESQLDWLVEHVGPDTRLADIDKAFVAKVLAARSSMSRRDNPKLGLVKPATVKQCVIRPLSAILHTARDDWGVPIPNLPKINDWFGDLPGRTREMSIREELALLPELGDYADLVRFILLTGLRRESALIRKEHVMLEERRIKVPVKATKTNKNKVLELKMTPRMEAIIRANIDNPSPFVFTYVRRTKARDERSPITSAGFSYAFTKATERAGIQGLVIHDLRRTAGARMYRATGNIGAVSKFLGHADVLITQRHYVHITPDDVGMAQLAMEAAHERMIASAIADRTID